MFPADHAVLLLGIWLVAPVGLAGTNGQVQLFPDAVGLTPHVPRQVNARTGRSHLIPGESETRSPVEHGQLHLLLLLQVWEHPAHACATCPAGQGSL